MLHKSVISTTLRITIVAKNITKLLHFGRMVCLLTYVVLVLASNEILQLLHLLDNMKISHRSDTISAMQ